MDTYRQVAEVDTADGGASANHDEKVQKLQQPP